MSDLIIEFVVIVIVCFVLGVGVCAAVGAYARYSQPRHPRSEWTTPPRDFGESRIPSEAERRRRLAAINAPDDAPDGILTWNSTRPMPESLAARLGAGPAMPVAYMSMLPPRPEPPLAELPPQPPQVPHAAPDVPRTCHCGKPAGHLEWQLLNGDVDTAFDTAQFPAVADA